MFGPGRREPVRPVGAGGRERLAGPLDQAAGDRPRAPHADGLLPAVTTSGMLSARFKTSVSGPGQNRARQALRRVGPIGDAGPGLRDIGHVDDQRIDGGPSLGREDPRDGLLVGGDGPEAVDGLGGEGDQPARRRIRAACVERGGIGIVGVDHQDASGRSA